MATVINGILSRKLPWTLGAARGRRWVIVVELLGIRSLTFAVGAYLSIATTLAIFVGGVMRWMVDRALQEAGRANPTAADGNCFPRARSPRPAAVRLGPDRRPAASCWVCSAVCAQLAEGLSE